MIHRSLIFSLLPLWFHNLSYIIAEETNFVACRKVLALDSLTVTVVDKHMLGAASFACIASIGHAVSLQEYGMAWPFLLSHGSYSICRFSIV